MVQSYWKEKLNLRVDGTSLREAELVPCVHHWVSDGTSMMTGGAYVDAIKIRSNSLPTRSRITRGLVTPNRKCRAGCGDLETIVHVLQHCHRTHGQRVKRHDFVANRLTQFLGQKEGGKLRRETRVPREPTVQDSDRHKKPDILYVDPVGNGFSIDVQIVGVYLPLREIHLRKVRKYDEESVPEIRDYVMTTLGAKSFKSMALTFTYHGLMAKESFNEMSRLGITKKQLKSLAVATVVGSGSVWGVFRKSTQTFWRKGKRRDRLAHPVGQSTARKS
jgi:hypothetical protein